MKMYIANWAELQCCSMIGCSGRIRRNCKTVSVLCSSLYGKALFTPDHCYEFLCF